MKYKNASEILPDSLLKELQKYASGETIYVPSDNKRKKWGEASGSRKYYKQRNEEIRDKYFRLKIPIWKLGDEYGLSEETVKSICYK